MVMQVCVGVVLHAVVSHVPRVVGVACYQLHQCV